MKKVSIIIPAYNCEKTLVECLSSVVNQTLKDIEIIIVNDASTDSTWDIILQCEAQFPELIMAINSEQNKGAGGARNIGLMYAGGEYIGFVDSDDVVVPNMFEKLYNEAKRGNYDMVDSGYYSEEKDIAIVHTADENTGELNGRKRSELIVSGGYLCSRIFKRELLTEGDIFFRENVILEDCEYLMYIINKAKRVGNVKEILYNYRYFKTSSSKYVDANKYYNNALEAIDAVYRVMSPLDNYNEIQEAVEYVMFQLASYTVNMSLSYGKREKQFDVNGKVREVCQRVRDYIKMPYATNKYICNKISKQDMQIMKDVLQKTVK